MFFGSRSARLQLEVSIAQWKKTLRAVKNNVKRSRNGSNFKKRERMKIERGRTPDEIRAKISASMPRALLAARSEALWANDDYRATMVDIFQTRTQSQKAKKLQQKIEKMKQELEEVENDAFSFYG